MSTTFPLAEPKENRRDVSVIRELNLKKPSDEAHGEPMTRAEQAEMAELREMMHQLAASAAFSKSAAPWWLSPAATVLGVIIAVFGVQFISVRDADLKHQVGLHDYQLKERESDGRQLSDRMFSLEFIFARVRQDLAAYGFAVDPQTGAVTQINKKRK